MGSIWQSDRFKLGMAAILGVILHEIFYLATGTRMSTQAEVEIVGAIMTLIGFDALRKMRKTTEEQPS